MAVTINELETGMGLLINDAVWIILELNHVKPGKGAAFVRVRVRNIKTGHVLEKTFRNADRLDDVQVEERKMQYQYNKEGKYHFMDLTSYEEISIPAEIMGDDVRFFQDNLEVTGLCHGHTVLRIVLPNFIITKVTESGLGLKGDSSKAGTKPVTIDTGTTVQVPLFINEGEWVRIDTRTGSYVERVQK